MHESLSYVIGVEVGDYLERYAAFSPQHRLHGIFLLSITSPHILPVNIGLLSLYPHLLKYPYNLR
jgi:hypothetical protein